MRCVTYVVEYICHNQTAVFGIQLRTSLRAFKVRFQQKVYPEKVEIYETWYSGSAKRVQFMHPNGNWYTVWETTTVQYLRALRIFYPEFDVSLSHDNMHMTIH